jgi:hypothetical protein
MLPGCVMIARTVGADVLDKTFVDAGAPFRKADGSYRFDNVFRFAIGRKR